MKKNLIWLAKIGVSGAILGYLCYKAWHDHSFDDLVNQPKHGGLLAAALVTALSAMLLTVARWYVLVRALELPFSVPDAVRLGFASERGFVVALAYRLITVLLGLIGVYYYVAGRRQVSALIQNAEESSEEGPGPALALATTQHSS